jgi:hypothetical protein
VSNFGIWPISGGGQDFEIIFSGTLSNSSKSFRSPVRWEIKAIYVTSIDLFQVPISVQSNAKTYSNKISGSEYESQIHKQIDKREIPVFTSTRTQSSQLVPMVQGFPRIGQEGKQINISLHWIFHLPLVSCDGT